MNTISIIITSVASGFIVYELMRIVRKIKIAIISKKYAKEYVGQEIRPEVARTKLHIVNFE